MEDRTRYAAAALVLACAACSSDKSDRPATPPQPTTTAGVPPQPAPAPTPTPAPAPSPTVQTGPCDATMQVSMQTAIEERAKKELSRGLRPESTFTCQRVAEGEKVTVPVTINQGQCVAVLAHSFPNITDIDLFLKPNLGPNPSPLLKGIANTVLAQDSEQGPISSIGSGQSSCYKNAFPLPIAAVAEAVAKKGAGPIAIQVYKR